MEAKTQRPFGTVRYRCKLDWAGSVEANYFDIALARSAGSPFPFNILTQMEPGWHLLLGCSGWKELFWKV